MKKRALVLGLGLSGKSSCHYLLKQGYDVVGVDKKLIDCEGVKVLGEEEGLNIECDLLVKSPGIAYSHPIVKAASDNKVLIVSDIDLGLHEFHKKGKTLFAITGSNGKTTTTLLTNHILNFAGKGSKAVGNVGNPILSEIGCNEPYICVELSSYQLESCNQEVFDAGTILNITPNHLDRYDSFTDYAKAKFRLQHCLKENGKLFLFQQTENEFSNQLSLKGKEKVATILPLGYRVEGFSTYKHDLENLSVAYQFCRIAGVDDATFLQGAKTFKKPPHRIEFVRKVNDVTYINDSKSSSVDAVEKATLAVSGEVILIAGGVDKKASYKPLKKIIEEKVKLLLLIGQAAPIMENELRGSCPIEISQTLEKALLRAKSFAKPGQTVLFSPGCASFDQFKNYEHRGDVFKELINLF